MLGPLEVVEGDRTVSVSAPRQRALLAALLVHANQVVSTDRLLEEVWGDRQPEGGVKTLRYHVSKLRDVLEPDRAAGEEGLIVTSSPGYVLEVDREQVDTIRFERLVGEARGLLGDDPGRAVRLLEEALGLCRGAVYAEFGYAEFAAAEISRLEELHTGAIEDRIEALLRLGRYQEVVGELEALTRRYPLRERLWGLLMTALYQSGRQADALHAYQDARRVLGEELGIEPSSDLRDLEEKILLQDPDLARPVSVGPTDNLPVSLSGFVGRDEELQESGEKSFRIRDWSLWWGRVGSGRPAWRSRRPGRWSRCSLMGCGR